MEIVVSGAFPDADEIYKQIISGYCNRKGEL